MQNTMISSFILLVVVTLTPASLDVAFEQDIPEDTHTLNITACEGSLQYDLAVFEEPLTWYEAQKSCSNKGYISIEGARANSLRRGHVREYLQELQSKGTNTSFIFWAGLFRPEPVRDVWYKLKDVGKCVEFNGTDIFQVDTQNGELCSIVVYDLTGDSQVLKSALCNESFPYICQKYDGNMIFNSYTGMYHPPSTLPYYIMENLHFNSSKIACLNDCASDKVCIAFTYNHTEELCTILQSTFRFGSATYTIARTQGNVSHFAKAECNVSYYSDQSVSQNLDVNEEFPICGTAIDQTCTECTCPISNSTTDEIMAVEQERIRNLTIDPKMTSAYQRTLTSAVDHRSSSRLVGIIGILCMAVPVTILLTLDILKWSYSLYKHNRKPAQFHENRRKIKPKRMEHDEHL